VKQIEVLKLL